ncbi:hypothetical protein CDAR_17411 [Caerostris darwini]|uniref:Uncharacterized protein n=1 Tax=Caerostris darwini TaxID=1538125 RepID=A0AAV4VE14_9ARAC|nr:hypothetical protein CDAR_17411 [Caerostris darwini]
MTNGVLQIMDHVFMCYVHPTSTPTSGLTASITSRHLNKGVTHYASGRSWLMDLEHRKKKRRGLEAAWRTKVITKVAPGKKKWEHVINVLGSVAIDLGQSLQTEKGEGWNERERVGVENSL